MSLHSALRKLLPRQLVRTVVLHTVASEVDTDCSAEQSVQLVWTAVLYTLCCLCSWYGQQCCTLVTLVSWSATIPSSWWWPIDAPTSWRTQCRWRWWNTSGWHPAGGWRRSQLVCGWQVMIIFQFIHVVPSPPQILILLQLDFLSRVPVVLDQLRPECPVSSVMLLFPLGHEWPIHIFFSYLSFYIFINITCL